MPSFLSFLLWTYHHVVVPGLGGTGSFVALVALVVVCLFPSFWYETRLRRAGVSAHEAHRRSQLLARLGFMVAAMIGSFFVLN